jgi:hypothetical protein
VSPLPLVLILVLGCTASTSQVLFEHAPQSPVAIEAGAGNLALGDVDEDGHLDLVVAGSTSAVTILSGDGTGRFPSARTQSIPLDGPPGELLLADVNADGHLDLACASHDSYGVAVLLGNGRGNFRPAAGSPFAAGSGGTAHNHGLRAGDVNEDGHADLVTVQSNDETVALLLGDGRGGFALASTPPIAIGPAPYPPALADLDGDGHLDIAVPETGTGRYYREHQRLARTVTLLLGDGRAGFRQAAGSPLTVAEGPYHVAAGDLDGNGTIDLVTTHDDSDAVTILLNDGKAGFRPAPRSPLSVERRAGQTFVVDANGDRRNDLVLATGESITVLLGDGRGGFSPAAGSPFSVGRGAWRVVMGDLDHDGDLDLASSDTEASSVSVLLGR